MAGLADCTSSAGCSPSAPTVRSTIIDTNVCVRRPSFEFRPLGGLVRVEVQIVNALTDGKVGGNPAGVVIDADALTAGQKLHVAQQAALSETAFVSKSDIATVKLEFFTPTRQIAHCGHATIATFSLLRELGRVGDGKSSKETIDGCRDIVIDGDTVLMEQRSPTYRSIDADSPLSARIAQSLGVSTAQIHSVESPTVVSTGNSFLMIALPDEQSVTAIRPDQHAIESISDELDLIGYYVFSTTTKIPGRHAGARMFAPRFGIAEESATGTAAGPLACLLYDRMGAGDTEMAIEQGHLMQHPSPSVIKVILDVDGGKISRLMAGGTGVVMRSITVEI
ncbi:PhzF family phenazine biosynthesis protein [Burkholderia lata]|uniref:PhzF family phenazine biosynthesis protein n=1 Tax=Burkholderia lata (strain ATCC 17760 / DSM 23089 / LMG 22485 / NCIMB 9086 / R18194 / 383) TaxID=482957 RepID=UPI0020C70169|nr:PhzF family phenazine biosynthesis protein [Burkholderia lata]